MPKAAPYILSWSAEHQIYTLYDHRAKLDLDLDSLAWHVWLEQTTSFAFRGQNGDYTARREQVKPGDWYWYAYQRTQKHVRKKYLGKSDVLTLRRFEEIAAQFNDGQAVQEQAAVSLLPALTHSAAEEEILAAKLHMPFAPQHLIMRTRLLTHLQGAIERSVTLICAPAGSGKSTLVSSWLRQNSLSSAWLSLDQSDNDAMRFWSYLFTALDILYPGVGERARHVLQSFQASNVKRALTLLLNSLDASRPTRQDELGEALLVLDDYHVISSEDIHRDMAFLVEHLPAHLHLIISTRNDPPLPLARLRVHDRLLELRSADLRFRHEETAAFFARQRGISLSADEIALLEESTVGWAAGLQLVALALRDQHERPGVLRSISGSQHLIAEYLGQEVLAHLPERIQQFLMRTSLLEQLEGRLCDAVSDQSGGAETLDWLLQTDLFLSPLDPSHRWYRYHPIFAEMLRQRLQQRAAEQIPELHRRASRWYHEQGMLTEAIAHARSGGDLQYIVSVAEEKGVELISRGETQMVMNWVAMLPHPLIFSRLRLFLYECWWRWYFGHTAVVAEMLREYSHQHGLPDPEIDDLSTLEQAISDHVDLLYPRVHWSDEQRSSRIAETLALYGVLAMQRTDGAAFSLAVCRRAVDYVAGMAYRARIIQHLSTVCLLRGDLAEATVVMEEALISAISDGSATWLTSIGSRLMVLYEMMGQLHNVTRISQQILQLASGKAFLTQGAAYIFLGDVAYERNHLEAAEGFFKLAIASCEEIDPLKEVAPDIHFLLGQLRLARIKFIWGDTTGTRQCLEEISSYLSRKWVGTEVLPVVQGEYALLMRDLGDESYGRQWLEEYPPAEQDEQLLLRQLISLNHNHHLVSMKLLLVHQRWQEAEQLLSRQQMLVERQGRTGNLIEWLTLRALLKDAQGEPGEALSAIACALSLAEPRGYMRVFLDEGRSMLPFFYRLRDELRKRKQRSFENPTPTSGYLDRLIILCKQERQTGDLDKQVDLVEPLSEREREVLWHISEGHPNREIAQQLVIALSTVKSHVKAIYTKLGVENRTQALAQARRLKLL
jgi:LuxR family maltose regulon positive regulatory protein